MIDLHCHILPGLDDGALDLADSIDMARQGDADGIELICATPHIRADHAVEPGELELARLGEIVALAPHLDWIAYVAAAAIIRGKDLDPPFAAE